MKTEVNEYLKTQSDNLGLGRSESISKFAKDFKCTIATVYRWIKSGDYYVMNGEIYKQVK